MNNLQRSQIDDWSRMAFNEMQEDDRKLKLHDQMLACIAWVIETTTKLHPSENDLDEIYRAYDFISEKRAEVQRGSRMTLS